MTKKETQNIVQACIRNISGQSVGKIIPILREGKNNEAFKMALEEGKICCQSYLDYFKGRPHPIPMVDAEINHFATNILPHQISIVVLKEAMERMYPFSVKR